MKYKLMWSLWPGFLGACALELLFFGAIDPHAISLFGHEGGMQAEWVYTLCFFVFWAICFGCSLLALLLAGKGLHTPDSQL